MQRLKSELTFIRSLVALNLSSALEYRASFITQVVGMFFNTAIYFVFWLIFFDKFGTVKGYGVNDVLLLFAVVPLAIGLSNCFAGNNGPFMADLIAQGRLDYYLTLPRNVLSHVICSRMSVSAFGDMLFAVCAFILVGQLGVQSVLLYVITSVLAALIFIAYAIIAGSLAFYFGNSQFTSSQLTNGMLTFALYPQTLFTGGTKFLLYTLLPATFVGAIPVEIIQAHDWSRLLVLIAAAVIMWGIAIAAFYNGLRRYESGSALNVNL